jgi:hypothetical protein
MSDAILEERGVPEGKVEPSPFDLVQMEEDLDRGGAFLFDQGFQAAEELPVGEPRERRKRHGVPPWLRVHDDSSTTQRGGAVLNAI